MPPHAAEPPHATPAGPPTGRAPGAAAHDERLWPGPFGWFLAVAAAGLLTIALVPVHPGLAAAVGAVALVGALVFAVVTSPRVRVHDGELAAGRARIPLDLLGDARALDREETRAALGPGLDARAYVCLRAWAGTAVRVEVRDPHDPTPYWLVSTRRPAELAAALHPAGTARDR
ncbi:DUF3093 domain-containing protein [Cellulomonas cellasea]|uniref:DUF3093 domain-containing protein n=2 Tax=Cellulomonas cellasea TaxID=43670 RepID=A0A0A0B974_9CELL|nr:DUF3093 domain-containing protein [Cellulomonas cellasea]KGM02712.1 hypothetical protein Q760_11540 [Cellulomonas cellasea DSM 20118]GEA90007.1 membrane protein [Cellulomonas cellasea]